MPKLLLLILSTTLMAPPVDSFAASSPGSHFHAGAAKVSYYIGVCLMICMTCAWVACHYYLLCHSQLKLAIFKHDQKSLSSCHHPHGGKAAATSHPIGPSLKRVPTGGARGQGGVRDVSPPQRRRHRDTRRDERPPRLLLGGILVGHRDGDGGRQAIQDEAHADLRVGGVSHLFVCILLLIVCFVLLRSTRAYRRRHPT